MTGNINYQVNQIWQKVDGIGQSKADARAESNIVGQNGHAVSDKVHSFNSKDEFMSRAKEVGNYAKENFGIKDMQQIDNQVITSYIQSKIESGLKYDSISTYISQLEKLQVGLSKFENKIEEHGNLFDRNSLIEAREMAKEQATKSEHTNRAFERPDALRSELKADNRVSFDLQREHGLRVNEATYIKESQLKDGVLTVQGKGGYTREIELRPELANRIESQLKANEGKIEVPYTTYREDLVKASEKTNQDYQGTHGLRYNYAQEQVHTKQDQGLSHSEAKTEVSHELGHHREEITDHYL
jgi:hypothetical protein